MPYNSETGAYERRTTTVIDATPDGDTVAVAIDVKLDTAADDAVLDLNHHKTNGNHYPATSTHTDSRFLKQSPIGVVSWADGVVAADAALKDFSNVASGGIPVAKLASGILPAQIAGVAYVKTNILGTVSQSGGVPTGAFIEYGANANGSYLRLADGSQICTLGSTSNASSDITWTFPSVFAATPVIACSCKSSTGNLVAQTRTPGLSSVDFAAFVGSTGARIAVGFQLIAIGRWF